MNQVDIQTLLTRWNPHLSDKARSLWQGTTPRSWYLSQIEKTFTMRHIVVLTGVRRSGKSVLLHQLMQRLVDAGVPVMNVVYINLEDIVIEKYLVEEGKHRDSFVVGADLLERLYHTYKVTYNPQGKVYLFLDEVQGITACNHVLNTWYESQENLKVFVSGSHRSIEDSETATLLTGRTVQFFIRPLNFVEYLTIQQVSFHPGDTLDELWRNNTSQSSVFLHHLNNYLREGGFPEIVLAKDENEKRLIAQGYYRDFLARDIIAPRQVRNAKDVEVLGLRILADFTKTHTYRKLGIPLKLAPETIKTYLEYFYDSYLFSESTFFSYSTKETQDVQKPKKIYTVDNGLRNYNVLRFSPDLGRNAENLVFNELKQSHAGVFYWQNKKEVDFIVMNGDTALYNCSYTDEIPEREVDGLVEALHEFGKETATLLTKNIFEHTVIDGKRIDTVPLWVWLLSENIVHSV